MAKKGVDTGAAGGADKAEGKPMTVAKLVRESRKEQAQEFAALIGVHPVTQSNREHGKVKVHTVGRNLYRTLLAMQLAGLRDLADRALNYPGKKSEEESLIRLLSALAQAGRASIIEAALSERSELKIGDYGEIKMEYALPILEAMVKAAKKEAASAGDDRSRIAAEHLDAALLHLRARDQERREREALELVGALEVTPTPAPEEPKS